MKLVIMNYVASDVTIINNCPDDWEEEQINDYLFSKAGLGLRESDVCYMASDDEDLSFSGEEYREK